jgi:hypothetical protein
MRSQVERNGRACCQVAVLFPVYCSCANMPARFGGVTSSASQGRITPTLCPIQFLLVLVLLLQTTRSVVGIVFHLCMPTAMRIHTATPTPHTAIGLSYLFLGFVRSSFGIGAVPSRHPRIDGRFWTGLVYVVVE